MVEIAHEINVNDKATHSIESSAPIDTGAWTRGAAGVNIGASESAAKAVPGEFPSASALISPAEKQFDAHAEAAKIDEALRVPFFSFKMSGDGDKVFNEILNMTPAEFKATAADYNKNFAAAEKPYFSGAEPWTLKQEVDRLVSSGSANQIDRLMESKGHNDVPLQDRIDGQELLKAGSPLQVGVTNAVTLPDGRRYDVYIPKNADKRAPVLVAMHGAAGGDSVGLMATESGLTADAERTGQTVIFAYPEVRKFPVGPFNVGGVAWNAPGRENLPAAPSNVDDVKYIDNVLQNLSQKTQISDKVGMFGFSDGGRFAQVYAAERPDKVSAIVSEDGTWMRHDAIPTVGKPIMIVHGDSDETLPLTGGMGSVSRKMDHLLGTNLRDSAPYMQAPLWSTVNQCEGPVKVKTQADIRTIDFTGCKVGEVKEYILAGGQHGINDYKNQGSHIAQWVLGSPDRNQDFSTKGAEFLKKWTVSQPSLDPRS